MWKTLIGGPGISVNLAVAVSGRFTLWGGTVFIVVSRELGLW